jgi:hypothetical protein
MKAHHSRLGRWTVLLTALLSGGTLFGTCEMRVRDALVDGSKSFLLSGLFSGLDFLPDEPTE